MNNNSGKAGGIGFLGLLTILFIALKLLNVIHWPWIMVFSPIWIPIVLLIIFLVWINR